MDVFLGLHMLICVKPNLAVAITQVGQVQALLIYNSEQQGKNTWN